MNDNGFVRIACATNSIKVADVDHNIESILHQKETASRRGADVLLFPELSVTGCTCGDLINFKTLTTYAQDKVNELASKTSNPIMIIGLPVNFNNKVYNCAAILAKTQVLAFIPKDYSGENTEISWHGKKIPFGKDILFTSKINDNVNFVGGVVFDNDLTDIYPQSSKLVSMGANVIFCLSSLNELVGMKEFVNTNIIAQSKRLSCAYIYASPGNGESSTDKIYSGHCVICEKGKILQEVTSYDNCIFDRDVDIEVLEHDKSNSVINNSAKVVNVQFTNVVNDYHREIKKNPFVADDKEKMHQRCSDIFEMQAQGLAKRMRHTNSENLILGISGGLDSSYAMLVAVRSLEILNKDNSHLIAISMPCFGTTSKTKNNAKRLSLELKTSFREIDISNSVKSHLEDIGHSLENYNPTYENAQARERTQVLMDVAGDEHGFVVGTGDLSEASLGWCTYNGDHMSMYNVNESIPKSIMGILILERAIHYGMDKDIYNIVKDIVDTPISPELLPTNNGEIAQKTEEVVGPYELNDFFLYYTVRYNFSPKKIYYMAMVAFKNTSYSNEKIKESLKNFYSRFFSQQFKRSCSPDGPKVGTVSLSPRGEWNMPSDACWEVWKKELEML